MGGGGEQKKTPGRQITFFFSKIYIGKTERKETNLIILLHDLYNKAA